MDLHTHAEGAPTQPDTAANEVTYVCMCTGTVITIAACEEPQFVLGQLIILVVAILTSGSIWLICAHYSSVAG
jgi:hypothetical protein